MKSNSEIYKHIKIKNDYVVNIIFIYRKNQWLKRLKTSTKNMS